MLSGWILPALARSGASFEFAFAVAAFVVVSFAGCAWTWRANRPRAVPARRATGTTETLVSPRAPAPSTRLDTEQVLAAARTRFLRLQAAWDAHDLQALGLLTTPDMLEELKQMLLSRGQAQSRTDVVSLHAELVGLEEVNAAWLAAIEFSGLIRESNEAGAQPFRELWMLASTEDAADGSSWRLARQQALL